jgi:pyridoxal phosphate enzyme (YggS family)
MQTPDPIDAEAIARAAERLARVEERIAAACALAGRRRAEVTLVAVSKGHPAAAIRALHGAGQRVIGESYVQEALDKQAGLLDLDLDWHFIGRIQANKTRPIAGHFAWVHGLADPAHARRLAAQRPAGLPPLRVCIQVNLGGEASKAGVEPAQARALIELCRDLPGLAVVGLMTLPPPAADAAAARRPFAALRALAERLRTELDLPLPELSMGMSDDLEAAILEGTTLVRVGTALLGPRPYNPGPGRGG